MTGKKSMRFVLTTPKNLSRKNPTYITIAHVYKISKKSELSAAKIKAMRFFTVYRSVHIEVVESYAVCTTVVPFQSDQNQEPSSRKLKGDFIRGKRNLDMKPKLKFSNSDIKLQKTVINIPLPGLCAGGSTGLNGLILKKSLLENKIFFSCEFKHYSGS